MQRLQRRAGCRELAILAQLCAGDLGFRRAEATACLRFLVVLIFRLNVNSSIFLLVEGALNPETSTYLRGLILPALALGDTCWSESLRWSTARRSHPPPPHKREAAVA